MMTTPVKDIAWDDYSEAIPAFVTLLMMPLAYSISEGIMLGMISYALINACAGKFKKVSVTLWILAALFLARYVFLALS